MRFMSLKYILSVILLLVSINVVVEPTFADSLQQGSDCSIKVWLDGSNYSYIKTQDDESRITRFLISKGYQLVADLDSTTNFVLNIRGERTSESNGIHVSSHTSLNRNNMEIHRNSASRIIDCQNPTSSSYYEHFRENPIGSVVGGTIMTLSDLIYRCSGNKSQTQTSIDFLDSLITKMVANIPSCSKALAL